MTTTEEYQRLARRQLTELLRPLSVPDDWFARLYAEKQSERDTLYTVMQRLVRRLREEDYEATTGLKSRL